MNESKREPPKGQLWVLGPNDKASVMLTSDFMHALAKTMRRRAALKGAIGAAMLAGGYALWSPYWYATIALCVLATGQLYMAQQCLITARGLAGSADYLRDKYDF